MLLFVSEIIFIKFVSQIIIIYVRNLVYIFNMFVSIPNVVEGESFNKKKLS